MPHLRFDLGIVLALLLALLATPAAAQESADALIDRALDLRESGNDVDARPLILRARELDPTSPRIAAQLGLVEQALGMWVLAEQHIQEGLGSPSDPWIRRRASALRQSLDAVGQRLGTVEILTNVPGATLSVGGVVVGTTPLAHPLRMPLGTQAMELALEGYRSQSVTLVVTAGQLTRQVVDLQPAPAVVIAPAIVDDPTPVAVAPPPSTPHDEGGGSVADEWWFWTLLAVVVVGAGVGIGLGVALSGPSVEPAIPGDVGPGHVIQTLTAATF